MLRAASAHTWLGTIASIITIVAWLTGLQTVGDIALITISGWKTPRIGIAIALLVVSYGVIYGAFFIFSTIIFAKVHHNAALRFPVRLFFIILSVAIGLVLYDTFFGIRESLENRSTILLGLIFIIGPAFVNKYSYENAQEWACGLCGRFTLVQTEVRKAGISNEKNYIETDDGYAKLIEKFQNYEVKRQCQHCGAVWTYHIRCIDRGI